MDKIDKDLLAQISDLHKIPEGAYNIRKNGQALSRNSTSEIEIIPKKNKSGIDVVVKPNVKGKSVHIPVIITVGGLEDLVYNDFYIGEDADVTIVAGCGIHNPSSKSSVHNGIHSFHLGKNSNVNYVERHLGSGKGSGDKILNPVTKIDMKDGSNFEMETTQLWGVTSSKRTTSARLGKDAKLVIKEKILTTENQTAATKFDVELLGEGSSVDVISRSVAKDNSYQCFVSKITGKNRSFGHVSCDGILVGNARIDSTPKIICECVEATLVHEAAIGKIAGEQLTKLETLGLDETEAEDLIIKGFLK